MRGRTPKFLDNKRGAARRRRVMAACRAYTRILLATRFSLSRSLDHTQLDPSPESSGRRVAAEL